MVAWFSVSFTSMLRSISFWLFTSIWKLEIVKVNLSCKIWTFYDSLRNKKKTHITTLRLHKDSRFWSFEISLSQTYNLSCFINCLAESNHLSRYWIWNCQILFSDRDKTVQSCFHITQYIRVPWKIQDQSCFKNNTKPQNFMI